MEQSTVKPIDEIKLKSLSSSDEEPTIEEKSTIPQPVGEKEKFCKSHHY